MNKELKTVALAVLATVVSTTATAGELLTNGNFEAPGFGGTSTYYNIGIDHAVPTDFGWQTWSDNVDIVANGVAAAPLANGGNYVLDLVGYGTDGGIIQFFTDRPGGTYTLSFDYSENYDIDGAMAVVYTASGLRTIVTGTHDWQHYSSTFSGTGYDAVLFAEAYGAHNSGVYLDNISVTGATIPEPASWALLVAGFGLVGFAARRRTVVTAA